MAQRIQDLTPLSRPLQDSDMIEIQGGDVGSARTSAGAIKDMAVTQATTQSEKALSDHKAVEAANDVLGHVKLVNNALPPQLIPTGYDATYQQFAGSFIQFSSESNLPNTVVPCLGGIIYPDQFADNLVSLKSKIPASWVKEDDSIQLPNLMDRLLTFSPVNGFGNNYELSPLAGQRYAALHTTTGDNVPVSATRNLKMFSIVTCIVTGQINQITSNKTYYLHDPVSGEYSGMQIQLPVVSGRNEGVGFNPDIMKDTIVQRKQTEIADSYWAADNMCGDPVGILSDANQNPNQMQLLTLSKIPETVRTFNMDGIAMVFDIQNNGLYLRRKDNPDHYLALIGGLSYPGKNTWFNGGATLLVNTAALRFGSTRIKSEYSSTSTDNALQFSNICNANAVISVRGGQVLIQFGCDINNNDRVITPLGLWTWLRVFQNNSSNQQYRDLIYDWMQGMPRAIMNKLERFPNIPMYRNNYYDWIIDANKDAGTIWYAEVPTKTIPYKQNELLKEFFGEAVTKQDKFGIQNSINAQNFDISTVIPENGRKLYIDGYIMTLDVKPNYFEWKTDEGYVLRVNNPASWDSNGLNYPQGNITANGCNASFKLTMSATSSGVTLIFPGSSKQPIQTTSGSMIDMYFYVRDAVTGISANDIPRKFVFESMITRAPQDRQDDAREFFSHFPSNWTSTQDQDKQWTTGGNASFRWYMKNIVSSSATVLNLGGDTEVSVKKKRR